MATPNYSYEKRQKELAKKRKKEDKLKRKGEVRSDDGQDETGPPTDQPGGDAPAAPPAESAS